MRRFRRGAAPTPRFIARGNAAIGPWRFATVPSRCLDDALQSPPCRQRPTASPQHSRRLACEQSRSMALVCLGDAPRSGSRIVQCRCNRAECADPGAAGISAVQRQDCSPSLLAACTWALAADQWPNVAAVHARVLKTVVEPEIGLIEYPFRPQGPGA